MANDDFDEIPSIVPERDELVSHRKRKRGSAATSGQTPVVREVVSTGTSGGVIFLLTVLFLGLLATGGAGYYFYQEGKITQEALLSASSRLMQLETRLNLVDEAAEQSSLSLVERVDTNFSEIDKLWAARNELRNGVAELKVSVDALKSASTALEGAMATQGNMLTQNANLLSSLQSRIEQINDNFSGMDNLGEQLTVINADLNRVKTAMSQVEAGVEQRLSTAEQDIESINVYRLQVNQSLSSLQDSINRLQQRVGQ